jgi:hypothetical protein
MAPSFGANMDEVIAEQLSPNKATSVTLSTCNVATNILHYYCQCNALVNILSAIELSS